MGVTTLKLTKTIVIDRIKLHRAVQNGTKVQ